MTKTQRKTARWVGASLLTIAVVLSGAMFHTLAPVPGEAQPSGPDGAYVVFHIANKTGAQVCGLNINFDGLEASASQVIAHVAPFERLTPTDRYNHITLGEGCLKPDEEAVFQFVQGVGMNATLSGYSWIKTGKGLTDLLIPGTFDGVWKEVITPRQPIPVLPPLEEDTAPAFFTTFTFELQPMPRGRLLVSQDMIVYEGQPVGIYDQDRQQELSQKLNSLRYNPMVSLFNDRQQLQQQLDALTIYSPFSGQIKHLTVETTAQGTRVTLELQSLNDLEATAIAPINS